MSKNKYKIKSGRFPTTAYLIISIVAILAFLPSMAQADETNVRAWIDGRSQIIINSTAQWHHFDYVAPGRWYGDYPTYINNNEWWPEWPDGDGYDSYSSVYYAAEPILPPGSIVTGIDLNDARGTVSIIQYPGIDNDYTAIVEFDDNPQGGAYWYNIDIVYEPPPSPPVPELGTIVLTSAGIFGLLLVSRRYR